MSKAQEMQKIIRLYREETGRTELDMHDIAMFAMHKGLANADAQESAGHARSAIP